MYHVEMRMGMQVVREFNLSEQRLWLEFLEPLLADREFTLEGHEFTPRQTRLKVWEGPELRPDQLGGMGRGWQNVERAAVDVTERVLAAARAHVASQTAASQAAAATAAAPSAGSAAVELLRERLIGRLSAGPIAADEILSAATELMPESGDQQRLDAARHAAWELLERDVAQLSPNGR